MDIKKYKCIGYIVLVGILGVFIGNWLAQPPMPPITQEQRLSDMVNTSTRDIFCTSQGYDYSLVQDRIFGTYTHEDLQPQYIMLDGFKCGKKVTTEETESFSYEKYKRWIISTQLGGK